MAGSYYSGESPVSEVWVLDDANELRFYLSEATMATAIYDGYARQSAGTTGPRSPSLQHFSADGIVDCSAYIGLKMPEHLPFNGPEHLAWMRGDKAPWEAILKAAKKQRAIDRRDLTRRLAEYRAAALSGAPLPNPLPWDD